MEVLHKLQPILPSRSLMIIYKLFIRPRIDYNDVIYDQSSNESFLNKIESLQYKVVLAITGAIKGSSHDKLYFLKCYFAASWQTLGYY